MLCFVFVSNTRILTRVQVPVRVSRDREESDSGVSSKRRVLPPGVSPVPDPVCPGPVRGRGLARGQQSTPGHRVLSAEAGEAGQLPEAGARASRRGRVRV